MNEVNQDRQATQTPAQYPKPLRGPLWWRLIKKFILVGLISVLALAAFSTFAGGRPDTLGLQGDGLAALPDSPNCVASYAKRPEQYMDPINFWSPNDDTIKQIATIILANFKYAEVITQDDEYLHVEFTSTWFRFVDDVEFYLDRESEVVQFRSASRIGRSDLGVNRARMNDIRELLE